MEKELEVSTNLMSDVILKKYSINNINYEDLDFKDYTVEGRKGVSVYILYNERSKNGDGPSAAIVRYAPGAVTPTHLHPGWELVLVLDGELIDDRGCHSSGVLQTYPPGSKHSLSSVKGCTFLVVWEKPVVQILD